MTADPKRPTGPPPSAGVLARYAQAYARELGVAEGRVRAWVAYMILAGVLERMFRVHVHANLYAGWGIDNAFPMHWDPHDTLVLQVAGHKHWSVWNPTREHPVLNDVQEAEAPEDAPVFDEDLADGALLYIPRGWWHVATPLGEPCLHITLTINNKTGADLLVWLSKQLRSSATLRRDLPHLATAQEQRAYLADLKQELLNAWNDDLMTTYLAWLDRQRPPRANFHLPDILPD